MSTDVDRQVPPLVLPDEELALLWGDVTAIPLFERPTDEVLAVALRSLLAAGLVVFVPSPRGDEEPLIPIPAPPLLWVRDAMDTAEITATMTLTVGELPPRVWALYAFATGRMVLEEVLEGGFRSYVSYSPEELAAQIDGLQAEEDGDPADAEVSLPVVLTAPFDRADDAQRQHLVDAIDLILAIGRTDRATGEATELTLAEGVGIGRVRMEGDPPSPADPERITVTRHDWSGATVRAFLGV